MQPDEIETHNIEPNKIDFENFIVAQNEHRRIKKYIYVAIQFGSYFFCISIQRKWEKYYEHALTPLLTNIKFQSFTFSFNSNHPNQSIQMKLQPFEMKRCRNGLLFFLDHSFMALTFVTLFKRIQQTIGYTFCPFTGSFSFNQEWKVFSFRWPKWQRERERKEYKRFEYSIVRIYWLPLFGFFWTIGMDIEIASAHFVDFIAFKIKKFAVVRYSGDSIIDH